VITKPLLIGTDASDHLSENVRSMQNTNQSIGTRWRGGLSA